MRMEFCTIASGSSGNCIYVGSEATHLLVDVGISGKKAEAGLNSLGLTGRDLDGILVTHEHMDHVAGLGVMARKYEVPIYATTGTLEEIQKLSVLPKQFYRLRFSLNGIDMHRFRQSGDFHRHGSGAAADIIDYGSICQVQLANTDFPDFFLGHRSSAKFSLRPGSIP